MPGLGAALDLRAFTFIPHPKGTPASGKLTPAPYKAQGVPGGPGWASGGVGGEGVGRSERSDPGPPTSAQRPHEKAGPLDGSRGPHFQAWRSWENTAILTPIQPGIPDQKVFSDSRPPLGVPMTKNTWASTTVTA